MEGRYVMPNVKIEYDPAVKLAAVDRAIECLERYRGGRVVKGKHPLHKAIVELEKLCWRRTDLDGQPRETQPYSLGMPLSVTWYSLLRASRVGIMCADRDRGVPMGHRKIRIGGKPDPKEARRWANQLCLLLLSMRDRLVEEIELKRS
jgi:hypothetical protein